MLKVPSPVVSSDWLYKNLTNPNLLVLDATIPKVNNQHKTDIFNKKRIPNTRFFDLKKVFSVQDAQFPNTVLSPEYFEIEARNLGVNQDTCIVVYDTHGVYSSPRAWWLFKTMGFDNVAVLNGGLPVWMRNGYEVEVSNNKSYKEGTFKVAYRRGNIMKVEDVLEATSNSCQQILDARSSGRFHAKEPEPRAEIRGGHIPNSKSLPYATLILGENLKEKKDLKKIFEKINPKGKEMIFSCGSGITACVLALGATVVGYKDIAVYDGSWTEWGSLQHLPIEK